MSQRSRSVRTADYNAEEDANHEIPGSHDDHDTEYGNVLGPADTIAGIPECLLDEVNTKDKYQSTNNHDRYSLAFSKGCRQKIRDIRM
jgi:hypothetical protein